MRVERGCVGGPVLSADQVAGAVRTFLKRDAAGSTTERKVFQYCEASFVVQLHPSLRRKIIEYTAGSTAKADSLPAEGAGVTG